MDRPDWTSDTVDPHQPSAARMYDFDLGGSHDFASDRGLAQKFREFFPDGQQIAQANRVHPGLTRVVEWRPAEVPGDPSDCGNYDAAGWKR